MDTILLWPILLPLLGGLLVLSIPKQVRFWKEAITITVTALNLWLVVSLFDKNLYYFWSWLSFGKIEFALRLYHFSSFIVIAAAGFAFLICLYSLSFMQYRNHLRQFYAYLLWSLALANGAVLADNLLVLLFFLEGLLITSFGFIAIGSKDGIRTAIKAFIILGITDICLMTGIIITGYLAGTLTISAIHLPINGLAGLAFLLMMIGAIAKGGSMPFHSWIPDAAIDAPLPFMAYIPAALEKLLGIYLLARICLDMFQLTAGSWASITLMTIGAITIILAVMMALIQKDYKRLLSYHAISQVGYMILGVGTALPVGIIGGLFHMINHAMYKSCLFLTGGAVEKQAGTTDLEKLGGIGRKMPITFGAFIIAAMAISGVPPLNGFFSKELVYDGALKSGAIFYLAAVAGSFFTAASFLKLGHAAFLGKLSEENKNVKEAGPAMLVPMIVIAAGCILFGVYNALPLKHLIQPILDQKLLQGENFWGWPSSAMLVMVTCAVLIGALINHFYGVRNEGSGLKAVDHIHYAPGLKEIYARAEKRYFDPYDIGLKLAGYLAHITWGVDKAVDWIYEKAAVTVSFVAGRKARELFKGYYANSLSWALLGFLAVALYLMVSLNG